MKYSLYFIKSYPHSVVKLISQLSRETGVPIHTIRYYEKYGLFKGKKNPEVRSNNYTWYGEEVVEKIELIKEAKQIGFSLSEIKALLDTWHSKRMSAEKKKEVLQLKIKELDAKISNLKSMKKLLIEGIEDVEQQRC